MALECAILALQPPGVTSMVDSDDQAAMQATNQALVDLHITPSSEGRKRMYCLA